MRLTVKDLTLAYEENETNKAIIEDVNIYNKLHAFENIEEKHNVLSLDDLDKRLTALEIIKRELKYNIDFVDASDFRAYIDGMICCENKEEYDLLKEVLL